MGLKKLQRNIGAGGALRVGADRGIRSGASYIVTETSLWRSGKVLLVRGSKLAWWLTPVVPVLESWVRETGSLGGSSHHGLQGKTLSGGKEEGESKRRVGGRKLGSGQRLIMSGSCFLKGCKA